MRCLKFNFNRRDPPRCDRWDLALPPLPSWPCSPAYFGSIAPIAKPRWRATPVSAERGSTEIAPAGNEIAWGFSDRWFPLIQAVPPSATATGLQLTDAAPVAEFVPTSGEERSTLGPAPDVQVQQRASIPLPRRRPVLAEEFRVPLPRSRPDGPAPQSVFIAVGTTDDRYPN